MVSIIVPIYNVEKYLPKCIESIIKQTYIDTEIILVNDGSLDESIRICEEYATKDKRIKIINKSNGGLSSARNAGLDCCKGEYVTFIDSDDWIEPNYIEVLLKVLKSSDADIAQCGYVKEGGDEKSRIITEYNKIIRNRKEAIKQLYDRQNYIRTVVVWNKLYKKEIFDDIRFPEGLQHEDEAIIHEILYRANQVVEIDYTLYHYLIRANSITQSEFSIKRLDLLKAFERRLNFFQKHNEIELVKLTTLMYFRALLEGMTNLYYSSIEEKETYILMIKKKINTLDKLMSNNEYSYCIIKILWYSYKISPKLGIKANKYIGDLKKLKGNMI